MRARIVDVELVAEAMGAAVRVGVVLIVLATLVALIVVIEDNPLLLPLVVGARPRHLEPA